MKTVSVSIVLMLGLISGITSVQAATTYHVPMTADHWESIYYSNNAFDVSYGPDGMRIEVNSYRKYGRAMTKDRFDMSEGGEIRWRVRPNGNDYFGVDAALFGYNSEDTYDFNYMKIMTTTTHHSYGSYVMAYNTWYFGRIIIDPSGSITQHYATGDYDDAGGSLKWSNTKDFSAHLDSFDQVVLYFAQGDSYDNSGNYIDFNDVQITTNAETIPIAPAALLALPLSLIAMRRKA